MRGKELTRPYPHLTVRITPACAGKSEKQLQSAVRSQDHPRVCGEKSWTWISFRSSRGSPPRVRGKVAQLVDHGRPHGITPACAGKRGLSMKYWRFVKDHPRVCGEKRWTEHHPSRGLGSPPRVRGKVRFVVCSLLEVGITPACAGKSGSRARRERKARDHPRVCGEKEEFAGKEGRRKGSPPRVRGKGRESGIHRLEAGITPACAGKSKGIGSGFAAGEDHPRVCGEKTKESLKK